MRTTTIGKATLHLCDCMDYMIGLSDKSFDLAIVDPPYGIDADKAQNMAAMQRINSKVGSKAGRGWKLYKDSEWDKNTPDAAYWDQLFRVSKNQIVWGGNYMTDYLSQKMGWIVWNKQQRDFSLADGELAWSSFDCALRIFDMSRGGAMADHKRTGGRFHPTQKPVALYEWLLTNYPKPGQNILDTHLGSGSSAIAANKLGFEFVGCELDSDYYDSACERIENAYRQAKLFSDDVMDAYERTNHQANLLEGVG